MCEGVGKTTSPDFRGFGWSRFLKIHMKSMCYFYINFIIQHLLYNEHILFDKIHGLLIGWGLICMLRGRKFYTHGKLPINSDSESLSLRILTLRIERTAGCLNRKADTFLFLFGRGMIRLETLIELQFLDSSFSSCFS